MRNLFKELTRFIPEREDSGDPQKEAALKVIKVTAAKSFVVGSGMDMLGVAGIAAEPVPVAHLQIGMLRKVAGIYGHEYGKDEETYLLALKLIYLNIGINTAVEGINRIGFRYAPKMIAKATGNKKIRYFMKHKGVKAIPAAGAALGGFLNYKVTRGLGEKFLEQVASGEYSDIPGAAAYNKTIKGYA